MSTPYANVIGDFQRLLAALMEKADLLPDMVSERAALAAALARAQDSQFKQDHYRGLGQRATQDLKAALAEGKDIAKKIRGGVMLGFGPRDAQLVQFRVAPQPPLKP